MSAPEPQPEACCLTGAARRGFAGALNHSRNYAHSNGFTLPVRFFRSLLVRIGSQRPMSDLSGHHILSLDNSPQSRQAIADALRVAGCPVDVSGSDWYRSGDFAVADPTSGAASPDRVKMDSAVQDPD